jgi:Ni/Co efflux regulator RcnB
MVARLRRSMGLSPSTGHRRMDRRCGVPPMGFEWVRDDTDALLIDTNTGEILQVEYGVFA